jgi:hypothetical protein
MLFDCKIGLDEQSKTSVSISNSMFAERWWKFRDINTTLNFFFAIIHLSTLIGHFQTQMNWKRNYR